MISSETVTKIKAYIGQGQRVGEIASAYDVSRQTISKIASGRTHAAVLPARSVPQLSKEAERVKGGKTPRRSVGPASAGELGAPAGSGGAQAAD